MQERKLILVDHNEESQAVDNVKEAEILEIIDHHRLGSLETMAPVMFRNEPVGCTGTIMYEIYKEKELEIAPEHRRTALRSHHFRYADVPVADVYVS